MKFIKVLGYFSMVSLWSMVSLSESVTGMVYEKGSSQKKLLYTYKNNLSEKEGIITADAAYYDPQNLIVVKEDTLRKGYQLVKYSIDHKQLGKKGSIEVKDQEVFFTYEEDGKKKTDSEDLEPNFVIGPTLQPYLFTKWAEVLAGKTISVRYGVWDRLETVGFDFKKTESKKINNKDVIVVQMKPTSFVIAALVDPLYWYFTADGKELVQIVGRTIPKQKIDGKFKDLDAETVYSLGL